MSSCLGEFVGYFLVHLLVLIYKPQIAKKSDLASGDIPFRVGYNLLAQEVEPRFVPNSTAD